MRTEAEQQRDSLSRQGAKAGTQNRHADKPYDGLPPFHRAMLGDPADGQEALAPITLTPC